MEIERKFLVNKLPSFVLKCPKEKIIQGYLKNPNIRVRTIGNDKAFITIKSAPVDSTGITRHEFEYEIPVKDGLKMIELFCNQTIQKTRYYVLEKDKKIWEIDIFGDKLTGLILAEIELDSANEQFIKPDWINEEVTNDIRYTNAFLVNMRYETCDSYSKAV